MPIAFFGKPFFFGDVECPSSCAKEALNVKLEGCDGMSDQAILEWIFRATNAPVEALSDQEMVLINANKSAFDDKIWCVSVGDVFAISGRCYICDSFGWYSISREAAAAYFALPHRERGQFGNRWPVPQGFQSDGLLIDRQTKDDHLSSL